MKWTLVLFVLLVSNNIKAQETPKVAVFTPLYLDSAFNGNEYKLGNANLPKYMLQGLDFYHGIMLAIDSLAKEGADIDVVVFDTKSPESFQSVLNSSAFENITFAIACFNNRDEQKELAGLLSERKIPLVSVTYPNAAGIESNPYFIMLNSGLQTHVQEIYKYIQRNYPVNSNIAFLKGPGATDQILFQYFAENDKTTRSVPLKYKTIQLSANIQAMQLRQVLDSTKNNVIICGSINEAFGTQLLQTLAELKNHKRVVIGMPTWDGLKELEKPDYKAFTTIYTTPFNINRNHPIAKQVAEQYTQKTSGRPSDFVFKGFESMYYFSRLSLMYGANLMQQLADASVAVFSEFSLQPVAVKKIKQQTDYWENKRIYFIKKGGTEVK